MTTQTERPQGGVEPMQAAPDPIDPDVTIGHVHLRTADIDRVRDFYVGVLGFDVVFEARDVPGWGTTGDILFVSAGGYHHHLGFNTWKSKGGPRSPTASRGCTTSRCATPRARTSPTPSADSARRLAARASSSTTARTRRSTSPTRTATTSSSAGTARRASGRAARTATFGGERDFDVEGLLAEPPV